MNPYVFMTDSDSDLPFGYVDELNLNMVYMPYIIEGKEYMDDLGRSGSQKEYFDNMRAGAAPGTSLLPVGAYLEYFEPVFEAGKDLLFVAFSSQLSGTINNIYTAREELLEKYPERKMIVVDTLSISVPQSILILRRISFTARASPWKRLPRGWRKTSCARRPGSRWMTSSICAAAAESAQWPRPWAPCWI